MKDTPKKIQMTLERREAMVGVQPKLKVYVWVPIHTHTHKYTYVRTHTHMHTHAGIKELKAQALEEEIITYKVKTELYKRGIIRK